ncbi:MAG: hypothetical protein O2843_11145 [Chloroflexi bacterium]|nr:hypothetical protein [Chloroflexota bacterium]
MPRTERLVAFDGPRSRHAVPGRTGAHVAVEVSTGLEIYYIVGGRRFDRLTLGIATAVQILLNSARFALHTGIAALPPTLPRAALAVGIPVIIGALPWTHGFPPGSTGLALTTLGLTWASCGALLLVAPLLAEDFFVLAVPQTSPWPDPRWQALTLQMFSARRVAASGVEFLIAGFLLQLIGLNVN